jgi:hypothetical protein
MRSRKDIDEETDGLDTDEPDAPRRLHRKHVDEDEETEETLIDYGGETDEDGDEMDGYQVEDVDQ